MNTAVDPAHFTADPAQFGAGLVGDLFFREDAAVYGGNQGGNGAETVEEVKEDVIFFLFPGCLCALGGILLPGLSVGGSAHLWNGGGGLLCFQAVVPDSCHVVQKGRDMEKLRSGQGGTYGQGTEGIAEIPVAAEGDGTLTEYIRQSLLGLCLCTVYVR